MRDATRAVAVYAEAVARQRGGADDGIDVVTLSGPDLRVIAVT
ncbi:hypothetical protein [Streptomyces niveus]